MVLSDFESIPRCFEHMCPFLKKSIFAHFLLRNVCLQCPLPLPLPPQQSGRGGGGVGGRVCTDSQNGPFSDVACRENRFWVVLSDVESVPKCFEPIFSFLKKSIFSHFLVRWSVTGGAHLPLCCGGGGGVGGRVGSRQSKGPLQPVLPPEKTDSGLF